MEPSQELPIRRGRPKKPGTRKYNILIDTEDAEWAKSQPLGLSGMIRAFLKTERKKAQGKS